MACVILPSETARLVYGYLIKENLSDIAHQFLESSPYLMDCCQIVKSGYQFNTKLMGKDLPELLQEYSVIHNLVNTKISSLCKTSLLYKRIKLRCENLPEILNLILFWKLKNSKPEDSSSNNEKADKNLSNVEANANFECSNVSEGISESISDSVFLNKNSNSNSVQKDNIFSESLNSKSNCDSYSVNKAVSGEPCKNIENQKNECVSESDKNSDKISYGKSIQSQPPSENLDKNKGSNTNNESHDNSVNTSINQFLSDSRFNCNTSIVTIPGNSQCTDLVQDEMQIEPLVSEEEPNRFENPIKIVGIQEENPSERHSLNVFSKPLEEEGNMNLGNSSVVFVSPDVGNMAINQEQSQIIVIPFDYYKTQDNLQHDVGIDSNKELNLIQTEVINQQKNDIIFEEQAPKAAPSTEISLFSERSNKKSAADGNIMTENDFLKNRHLMINLEKELYKTEATNHMKPHKETKEDISIQASSAPVIVVPQTLPARTARYRTILPKKELPSPIHPVVVVHPLLENNKDIRNSKSSAPKVLQSKKTKREVKQKVRKKDASLQPVVAPEAENPEISSNPSLKPVIEETLTGEAVTETLNTVVPANKEAEIEIRNEEKENLEKTEVKKNETPVFITKRNSKRLSLSTPRRRSHIRALEFETPPKTNEEKKKSKTSPKMKAEPVKVERKSVRNTLFKSPIPEDTFKTPTAAKENKKLQSNSSTADRMEPLNENSSTTEVVEPLNELSIPIATRSPNTKLSDAWENLTGVGCVIGQNNPAKTSPSKKMWDADLRCFILENNVEPPEKKRMRKPEKSQRDNRKSTKKKAVAPKRIKPIPVTVSPSKISLTAKRNTYSINGNEEGSPIRTLLDDLKIVTPFKDIETFRPAEETPLTKLLRENINTIDIDLSMINTPSFPPTPSIVITPDLDDVSISGTNYYCPSKDCSKDKVLKITDYFKVDNEKTNKKESKEMHEKVIGDLVSKAKEIIGLGKDSPEENVSKTRPSGKILSMVKIQMLTQCDKKLMENIPINEESTFSSTFNQTLIGNVIEETGAKTDLKEELEEKRKRALKKIKVVKENLSQSRRRVSARNRKRRRTDTLSKSDKSKSDVSKESFEEKQETSLSDESLKKDSVILTSTPYRKSEPEKLDKSSSEKKMDDKVLDEIRQKFPPFQSDSNKYAELNEKSRKKFYYVESFLKLTEIEKFLQEYNGSTPAPKLHLKPSLRRFFHVFYKWLKHPHKRELNASPEINSLLKQYLSQFEKVNLGLNNKKPKKDTNAPEEGELPSSNIFGSNAGNKRLLSDNDDRSCRKKGAEKRKDEDGEDGLVSMLPLKKRKSTVQQVENKTESAAEKCDLKGSGPENTSQTQNFLQDIDVDRFLSQIHGQETR